MKQPDLKPDQYSPLAVTIPYTFHSSSDYPTEVLANRFQAWRAIIKDLVSYLREYASVQEEIVRQQLRLQQAVGISAKSVAVSTHSHQSHHGAGGGGSNHNHKDFDVDEINKFFSPIGNGSIQDIPTILTKFHQQNVSNNSKMLKELNTVIVPKLEELRKDLLIKIKEIKNLQNDFKNNLGKEIQETKNLMSQYYQAIEFSHKFDHGFGSGNSGSGPGSGTTGSSSHGSGNSGEGDHYKYDPYLVKIKLDRQLKRQLKEENYLFQAYENLQNSGSKLESIIVVEIQNYFSQFLSLINQEYSTIPDYLLPSFNKGFLAKESNFEWDSFISKNIPSPAIAINAIGNSNSSIKNGTFIDLNFGSRKYSDLVIADYNSALNLAVREGYLERRSKFLKNYSSGWYVLTCNYIHEFKTPDRKKDQLPVLSIPLDSCQVSEHSKDDGKQGGTYKFVLYSKLANGLIHRSHNWVFRSDTYQNMIDWYNDIKSLTSLATPSARARFLNKKLKLDTHLSPNSVAANRLSRVSTKSTTSNLRPTRTNDTNQSNRRSIKSKDITSQSSNNVNRVSSTFSSKHNGQSPRLNHLINSDGTIITPVESVDKKMTPVSNDGQFQYNHNQQPISNMHVHQDQLLQQQQQQQQQQQHQQNPIVVPQPYMPNYHQGYFMNQNGQQIQQFYDPIKHQYYTIQQAPPPQGPQPQYFPASPQPHQSHSPQPMSENSANQGYFLMYPGQQGQQGQQVQQGQGNNGASSPGPNYGFGGNLPYPTHDSMSKDNGTINDSVMNEGETEKREEEKESIVNSMGGTGVETEPETEVEPNPETEVEPNPETEVEPQSEPQSEEIQQKLQGLNITT